MKICSKCQVKKCLDQFYKDRSKSDGLRPDCKSCNNAVVKQYQMTSRGKEVAQKSLAKYRSSDYYKERRKDWYNTLAAKTAQKRWRESERGREYYAEYQARFRQTAKGIAHSQRHHLKRRMRFDNVKNCLTIEEIELLYQMFDHKCAYCSRGGALTIDHVVPILHQGAHSLNNCVPACRSCNSSKGTKILFTDWQPKNLNDGYFQWKQQLN